MLTAFSTLACPDWSWDEIVKNGSAWGYDGVEVRLLQRETDLLARPEFAFAQLDQRRRELEQHRFRVAGLASSVRFDSPDPAERQEQIRIGQRYVDLARELGSEFVRVFGDQLPPADQPENRRCMYQQVADGLLALGDYAADHRIQILLETHGDFVSSQPVAELFEKVSHPWVNVLWDTHHPWRFCGEPVRESFARLQPWIRHTHWKDSVVRPDKSLTAEMQIAKAEASRLMAGHRDADYVLFGEGEFPARECLHCLLQAGYQGWFSYEWEKAWHPEIAPPEIALPPFPKKLAEFAEAVRAGMAAADQPVAGQQIQQQQ